MSELNKRARWIDSSDTGAMPEPLEGVGKTEMAEKLWPD
jgi:hypothetical protein